MPEKNVASAPSEPSEESVPAARPAVGLSTSSVYPETTSSGFELARRLGYDGVELMVGIDPVAADIDAVEKLRDYHGIPVLAVHAPCRNRTAPSSRIDAISARSMWLTPLQRRAKISSALAANSFSSLTAP